MIDAAPDQTVSHIMERTLVFHKIGGGQPVAHHHVRIMVQHLVHHLRCIFHGICIIPVHHYIAFRIDFPEHSADYIPLPLHVFITDYCSRLRGKLHGPVTGIIVIHIHNCFRQRLFGIRNHFTDGFLLVVAWYQNRNLIHLSFSYCISLPYFNRISLPRPQKPHFPLPLKSLIDKLRGTVFRSVIA